MTVIAKLDSADKPIWNALKLVLNDSHLPASLNKLIEITIGSKEKQKERGDNKYEQTNKQIDRETL